MRCSGVGVFAGSLLQMYLQKIEQTTGDYPLVLAGIGHLTLSFMLVQLYFLLYLRNFSTKGLFKREACLSDVCHISQNFGCSIL